MRNILRYSIFSFLLLLSPNAKAGQNVRIGLGVGTPSGLALYIPLSDPYALQSTIGFSNSSFGDNLYLDADMVRNYPNGSLTGIFGVGVLLSSFRSFGNNVGLSTLGIRVPLGFFYTFNGLPLDLFLTVAPTFYLNNGVSLGILGTLGVRFVL